MLTMNQTNGLSTFQGLKQKSFLALLLLEIFFIFKLETAEFQLGTFYISGGKPFNC